MLRWSNAHREAVWIREPGVSLDFGPSGFEAYARLRFFPDPTAPDQQPGDIEWPDECPDRLPLLLDAVTALAPHTSTPNDAYDVAWNSGVSRTFPRIGHRVGIKDRDPSYLAEGPLGELATWHRTLRLDDYDSPSFIWPRDRAWCIAWDVDPHFAGVGGTAAAIDSLLAVPPLARRPARPRCPGAVPLLSQ